MNSDEAIEYPVDGVLDLHTFQPREVKELVRDYLAACRKREILQVRIVHGKGIGTLREVVHSVLKNVDYVRSFKIAEESAGGWGATIVELKKPEAR